MRVQKRNAVRDDLLTADRHRSAVYPLPIGRQGIYNGAFEQGPVAASPFPDGWHWYNNVGIVSRINTDSTAGAYCVECVNAAGAAFGATMLSTKLMPVSVLSTYVFRVCLKASGAGITIGFGAHCYDSAKATLGTVLAYNAAPGVAWTQVTQNMGAAGTAFAANTRYIRFYVIWNDVTAGNWVRIDNIYLEA